MTIQKPLDNQLQHNLANNPLSGVLDELIEEAANFPMPGIIEGAIVLDGDGRTIATSGRYLRHNLWEISALSAALAGIAKQGQVYLQARAVADIMVLYGDKQFYVCHVGKSKQGSPILLAIVADIRTNIGFVRIRMQQTAKELVTLVENDASVQRLLELPEEELEGAMRVLSNVFTGSHTE